jgi:hypothetical protein
MKRFFAACVLCTGLLALAGCNQTESEPAAQAPAPATDSADRQEVMKPAMEESTDRPSTESATPESPSTAEHKTEKAKP